MIVLVISKYYEFVQYELKEFFSNYDSVVIADQSK